jgi:hypothetical protein
MMVCLVSAPASFGAREQELPAGTVLKVKLDNQLGSGIDQPGDRFTATLVNDDTRYNLPSGTRVEGVVNEAQPATSRQPGTLDLSFRSLRLPDGESYPIAGSPISLDSKSITRTSDGRLEAKSSSSSNKLKFIGYGAGAGFLIGSLLGSNIKGALGGALAGYLYGQFGKSKASGHDVVLKPGTEFGVRLDQRVALNPAGYNSYRSRVSGYRSYQR